MMKIKNWKYPENVDKLDEKGKQSMERYRRIFPKDFTVDRENIPLPFPILIDADHSVSSGLGLFTTNWGGSQVEQNMPTVYLIDDQGILKFKYIGQNTLDRPEYDYLLKILEMIKEKKLWIQKQGNFEQTKLYLSDRTIIPQAIFDKIRPDAEIIWS